MRSIINDSEKIYIRNESHGFSITIFDSVSGWSWWSKVKRHSMGYKESQVEYHREDGCWWVLIRLKTRKIVKNLIEGEFNAKFYQGWELQKNLFALRATPWGFLGLESLEVFLGGHFRSSWGILGQTGAFWVFMEHFGSL